MIPLLLAALLQSAPPKPVLLETPEGARQPQVAVDVPMQHLDGRGPDASEVYVVYGTRSGVHVSISRDAGESFGAPREIGTVGALALGMRRGPRIVLSGETIVVTAIAGTKGGGRDEDVLAWRSTDRGDTWTFDGTVNEDPAAAREGLHAMAVGPTGKVFCVWIDLAKGGPRICGASSVNEGDRRWSTTRVVFDDPEGICPCCPPSAAIDAKNRLYVMWRGHAGASRDMVVAQSDDGGLTFTKPTKLGTGTWKLEACPMDGGAIDVRGGDLRTIWRRESSVYRARLGEPEQKLGDGEQPTIVTGSDGEYAAWIERRGGRLMLLRPRLEAPIALDERANDPVLASGASNRGRVYAAWESGPSDAPRIAVARLDAPPAAAGK